MTTDTRQAVRADIPAMHDIRMAVRENRLISTILTEADYVDAIESTGRGWVSVAQDTVVGFAVGNALNGNIWALFVHPDHQARGHGRRLHVPCGADIRTGFDTARATQRMSTTVKASHTSCWFMCLPAIR